jgi:hypothetical protein
VDYERRAGGYSMDTSDRRAIRPVLQAAAAAVELARPTTKA